MNYLAHAYLSFDREEILVGNMISDFVKGKNKFNYSSGIQHGIALHRSIDNFTDTHVAVAEAKKVFKPSVGLYAGAFVDVAFDHFLALDEGEMSLVQLNEFAEETYNILYKYQDILPATFAVMLPYMKTQNWLVNYRHLRGLENSFGGLVRRAKYLDSSVQALEAFEKEYDYLAACYKAFFPFVKQYALEQLNNNL